MSQCPNCGTVVPSVYTGPQIHSYETAAKFTSLSIDYIRKAVSSGELLCRRVGRRVTIHHDDLMEWYFRHPSEPVEAWKARRTPLPLSPRPKQSQRRNNWD
ncbi:MULTISPECIES: excisionase family DNA-binding protein [Rhodococcus]|uniref:Helix-turn-helix domain-containing protein n=1 Tax=Rhodococcus ruber TaxID=1830 RepID=A0A098BX89_9NOCA|nr:hypothetical protein F1734_09055 [Rhodococcus ruber]CDZ92341.1 hypothetical protein RHRU231_930220 [Rhodococcus ruber]